MTTIGEYRVGVSFNPSGSLLVDQIKRTAADLIDLIESVPTTHDRNTDGEIASLKALAMRRIEAGAMWGVKAATKPLR